MNTLRIGWISLIALATALATAPALADADSEGDGERKTRFTFAAYAAGSWGTADLDRAGFPATSDTDSSFFFGASLGIDRPISRTLRLRLEIDGTNERRFTTSFPGGNATDRVDIEAWSMTGNFWFVLPLEHFFPDTPIVRRIEPFGGGGIGFSRNTVDVDAPGLDSDQQKARFAWIGGFGASIEITRWLDLETRYQYADLGKTTAVIVDGGGTPQGGIDVDLSSHELLGGLRFSF